MMPSERAQPTSAFIWIWLPGETEPVVAGRVDLTERQTYVFAYGQSYLSRADRIPLYLPELPLVAGAQEPPVGLEIAGSIADAGPDSWGQRVILAEHLGHLDRSSDTASLNRITYFLSSGSNRIGGLDFQASAQSYVAREASQEASLDELVTAADRVERGLPLSTALQAALVRGTSIGGARPKVIIEDGGRFAIAKFSSSTDIFPVVKAEAVAMDLARRAGIAVPATRVVRSLGRDVLLVDRFDRISGGGRRLMVSALTILERSEMVAHRATYPELAEQIRHRFTTPRETLRELFTRIVMNIAVGNTDDHLRNHSAFWDGEQLTLTPAYDIAPQLRSGNEVTQALAIGTNGSRASRFSVAKDAASVYQLTASEAQEIIDHVEATIRENWDDAADQARLSVAERRQLWGRQILNESIFYAD